MDRGIWAIWYGLKEEHRRDYETWFHQVHIPEKLSRPGYLWAAHYALEADKGFLALFSGTTAHVFLNPSPGQLAKRQSPETKHFMQMRQQSLACILAEEARVDGPDVEKRGPNGTPGVVIQFGNYNAASPAVEDDLDGWYAQERFPLLAKPPGCIGARKMLATLGTHKHAILHEFVSLEMREQHFGPHEAQAHDPNTWMGRVRPQLSHAPRSPAIGRRIWPESN